MLKQQKNKLTCPLPFLHNFKYVGNKDRTDSLENILYIQFKYTCTKCGKSKYTHTM